MKRIRNIDELIQAVADGLEVNQEEATKIVADKVSGAINRCPNNVLRLNNSFVLKALYVGIMNRYRDSL